jgi:hypothetical protein
MQVDHLRGGSGEGDLGVDREVLVDVEELFGRDLAPAGIVVHALAGDDDHGPPGTAPPHPQPDGRKGLRFDEMLGDPEDHHRQDPDAESHPPLLLSLLTLGAWAIFVWLPLCIFKHEQRMVLTAPSR